MVEISRVTAKEAAKSIRPGTVKTVELLFQTSGGHVALVRVSKSQVITMLRRLPDGASVSIEILKGFQKATIAGAIGPLRGGDLSRAAALARRMS
ncbi:hypothetical protein [Bradyrhizobium sp. BR 10261]|uniref:hypothetical protein n=1 Tax=Bradyrhizobium sp. BR 10261 TaxID=2749992 RepID=UPI001C6469AC|nr:hypothetical protein [Bradyrhizobium sp. BR 10261]MBW7965287.1 hypothetical protein [Bradyrhizobium sp. BR 10261]